MSLDGAISSDDRILDLFWNGNSVHFGTYIFIPYASKFKCTMEYKFMSGKKLNLVVSFSMLEK